MRRGGLDGWRKPRDARCRVCGCQTATRAKPELTNMRGHLFARCWTAGCHGLWYLGTTEAGKRLARACAADAR